jgi:hypothetical protein
VAREAGAVLQAGREAATPPHACNAWMAF